MLVVVLVVLVLVMLLLLCLLLLLLCLLLLLLVVAAARDGAIPGLACAETRVLARSSPGLEFAFVCVCFFA